ncbi:MAG TPA: hypothetical protein DDW84_03735 [Phycisphaerales bacterium]|nr:MAG: hypothetical protein A2Y13_07805 [Planctomycetes bacterium GWC2_45_44]HBG77948.1 hypothetical protein [Phycisphaerales bacterium]HBR19900.1 hypothetical protein [Phycisphaerales bacterium]
MDNNKKLFEELLKADGISPAGASESERIAFAKILDQQLKTKQSPPAATRPNVWRVFMKSKITKFAVAAVLLITTAMSITIFNQSATPVYALEQTIQANHTVRYIHVKAFKTSHEEPQEFWCEFDEYGYVKNLRAEMPEWTDPCSDDGTKSIIWKDDKAQIWLPKKNILVSIKNKSMATQICLLFQELDPKLAIERLNEKSLNGKAKIDISEPSNVSEPIVVTVTSLQDEALNEAYVKESAAIRKEEDGTATSHANSLCHRMILYVEQATNLVASIELYRLKDGDYQEIGTIEYFDYNQPIDAHIFTIKNIPADVIVIDQASQEVGLLQGRLSDKEIAVEVVRQFLEALIAKDYVKAGRLYSGLPAEKVEQNFGQVKFLRIISIGEPAPSALTGGYKVPCILEIEKDGKVTQWSPYGPFVRQVHGQKERWNICGGI